MSLKFSGLRQLFAFLCENVGRGAVLKGQSSTYETFSLKDKMTLYEGRVHNFSGSTYLPLHYQSNGEGGEVSGLY